MRRIHKEDLFMGKGIKLSQCLIVKNEEDNIEQALSWGKGLVCEQVVVDTGSTDRTVEIARSMGAKVFEFPWTGDFSAAKNYAIEQAHGDWIAFLDADEYFKPEDANKMVGLIQLVETHMKKADQPHVISNRMLHLDNDGAVFSESRQDRIFKRMSALRYVNKIHEVICLNGGKGKLLRLNAEDDSVIFHTGYAIRNIEKMQKRERNISLLLKELEENPNNYDTYSYLGDIYFNARRIADAEITFSKVIEHIDEVEKMGRKKAAFCSLMQIMVERNQPEEEEKLLQLYELGKKHLPHDADLEYWVGMWMVQREDFDRVFFYLERCLDALNNHAQKGTSYVSGRLSTVYYLLAMAAQRLDDKPAIVKYAVLYLKIDHYNSDMLGLLLALFCWESSSEQNAQKVFLLLQQIYNFNLIKDKMTVLKSIKQVGFKNLEQLVLMTFTKDELQWLNS